MARLNAICRWWDDLSLPWRLWRIVLQVEHGDEVPAALPARGAVLVQADSMPAWLAFDCPCGRGHRVMVNLHPARHPRWRLRRSSPLTLEPSVDDRAPGRRCHFFLHRGRIIWVRGKERTFGR
jgi:hypothetical protein